MNVSIELGPVREDERRQVKIVLTHKKERARDAVPNVYVTDAQWDTKKKAVRFGVSGAPDLNERITAFVQRAERIATERPDITPKELRAMLRKPERSVHALLHEAFLEVYDEHKHGWRYGTKKQRRLLINDALRALPDTTLTGFDHRALLALDRWYVKQNLSSDSRRNRLIKFGGMYRAACELHKITPAVDPSDAAPAHVGSHRTRLTPEQVEVLRAASWQLQGRAMLAAHSWLLQYDLGGLRFNEVCRLHADMWDGKAYKWIEGKVPRPRFHPVTPKAQEIIDHYAEASTGRVLPLVKEGLTGDDFDRAVQSANAVTNKELKGICATLGLPKVTTHCARHSAAHRMKLTLKDVHMTSKILGHANVQVTEIYLDQLDTTPIEEAFAKLG